MAFRVVIENPYTGSEVEHRALDEHTAVERAEDATGLMFDDLLADLREDGEIKWRDEETGREVTVEREP